MPRVIIKTAQGPIKIVAKDGDKYICMCGLSKNQPYCDKSHLKTLDEKADSLYQYDEAGEREKLDVEDGECQGCCGDCGDDCKEDPECGECCKSDEKCQDCEECKDCKDGEVCENCAKSDCCGDKCQDGECQDCADAEKSSSCCSSKPKPVKKSKSAKK